MKSIRNLLTLLLLAVLSAVTVYACSGSSSSSDATPSATSGAASPAATTTVKVGSKDFTEAFILGEMYAMALENGGFKVERKLNLGGTPVAQAGLESGQIDLYPEYTGTGLLTVLKLPKMSDRQEVYDAVAKGYKEKFNLAWLEPAPMNNTQAFALKQETAEKYGIKTISDLVAKGSELALVSTAEFQAREDGLPGLKAVYGDPKFKKLIPVDAGLRYQALQNGDADVVEAFSTDGEISAFNLVVLEDDKGLYPPYQVAPVVRQETLDASPQIGDILNSLSPKITDATMQRLNYEVSGKSREPAEVAKEFLVQEGLVKQS
ncbi:glycine betaine ABC transporter substrate-binding protein [Leptolyngbya sp. FACHB-261]|uniref:glycine betaine ABC transporter substrate-binding protein n=1 Tax=Leptolyngbya sp. FACHB-261 TaxID=2692806 RepID=UPI00168438BB|nr:glycine betaine ABC transporter substrate-binding protein [Leptolyngbya sp. FACHB-261]MBD2104562.1 quaternary ammonium transporter [Leptolyngbya sp. FACHB-261]